METLDALGMACPIPVIKAKKIIAQMAAQGGTLAVLVDNKPACENLAKMAHGYQCAHTASQEGEGRYCVKIEVPPGLSIPQSGAAQADAPAPQENAYGPTVAIGRNTMGHGSDELGAILIKGFIFSLTQLPKPPKFVLFFNAGVLLTLEGCNTIDDLRELEKLGTKILVCGTCADFYQVKEQVCVGEITNMYGIAEQMATGTPTINL